VAGPARVRVYAFQDTLEALGAMHGHVYDDGDMFVLDLATLWGAEAASDLRRARVRSTLAPISWAPELIP
jgi:hypothetical protein